MTNPTANFAEILHPLTPEEFFGDYRLIRMKTPVFIPELASTGQHPARTSRRDHLRPNGMA